MRASSRRVVVTGIGLVTPLGLRAEQNWTEMLAGRGGVGPITRFDTSEFPVQIAGEVRGFDAEAMFGRKEARKMDRFIHYAMAAAKEAMDDSGLAVPLLQPERVGVQIGVGLCGIETIEEAAEVLRTKGPKRISPFMIPRLISNLAPGQVSMAFGAQGPNLGSVSACATGAHSVGDAARLIAMGDCDVVIAGGAEASITPLGIAGFASMRALSTRNDAPERASRPFDADRDGFVSAEGSGVVVLELLEHALARGAHIYAELVGYGQSSDAYHITLPHPEGRGAIAAMNNALLDGGLNPDDVRYINAHGTSTDFNDATETLAIRKVFGAHADQLWVSSTKSMTGHMLGAAGAVEAAVCALTIDRGVVPPTINYETPDPACDLDYVPNSAREGQVDVALSNSFGFGGTNVCLAFRRYEK